MNISIKPGMPIMVTGGNGRIGSYVVKGLHEAGYIVKSLDRMKPKNPVPGVKYAIGDITDFNFLLDQMEEMVAVVHLAALPSPGLGSTREIMRINVLGAFHVFQAAVKKGLLKVVQASSINYLGIAYGKKMFRPEYFPVDEEHPGMISDAYSLSKKTDEDIAMYFWNRDDFSSISLRFPGVFDRSWLDENKFKPKKNYLEIILAELEKISEIQRTQLIEEVFAKCLNDEYRKKAKKWDEASDDEKLELARSGYIMKAVRELFAYLENSDCLQSIIKSLQSDLKGSYPLFVNAADTGKNIETIRLIKAFFPWVNNIKREFQGNEPLLSYEKAKKLIGFEPQFSLLRR